MAGALDGLGLARALREPQAIKRSGHDNVAEHQVEWLTLVEQLQGPFATALGLHQVAQLLEHGCGDLGHFRVVFHQQDPGALDVGQ